MTVKNLSIIGLVAILVVGIVFWYGRNEPVEPAEEPEVAVSDQSVDESMEEAQPLRRQQPGIPAEHPAIEPATSGIVTPDPDAQYTHFRVGERNVRRMVAEGDVMWVGTSGGVIRYNTATDQFRHYSTRVGLLANGVFHLSRWRGKLAIGTYGGGLSLLDEESDTFKHYNIPEGLADAFVYDMLETEDGHLWIATWSGANLVIDGDLDNPDKWQIFTVENTNGGLPNDWVYGLARGENGVIWFATEGGLARYKDGVWDNWNHEDGQGAAYELVKDDIQFKNDPAEYSEHHTRQKVEMGLQNIDVAYNPNYIVALLVTKGDIVWAGTWGGGLAKFDGENWTNYTVKDGLPSNHVFMLYQDNDGQIWVGTGKGLARMEKDGSFSVFGTADGLYSDIIFSMRQAADGRYWIGSYGAVTHIKNLP